MKTSGTHRIRVLELGRSRDWNLTASRLACDRRQVAVGPPRHWFL